MPQLHDRTRREICIAAFFAVCVLPTCCLFAWGISRHSPWHASAYVQRLESCLGLDVSIDGVEHPLPGVVRYVGVRLCDPETGQVVANFHRIEARLQDVQDQAQPALRLKTDSAQICTERFDNFVQILHRVMARRMSSEEIDLRIFIAELKLQSDAENTDDTTTLTGVRCSLQTVENGSQAEFSFRLDSSDSSADPVHIHIRRDRRDTPASICFDIDSRNTPMPCDLMALLMPQCKSLGPRSCFQGYLFAEQTTDGWQGFMEDTNLSNIDLAQLLGVRFPNTLTGQAQATIQQARFSDGRLQEAKGSLAAGPGTVGREFYYAVWNQLYLDYRELPSECKQVSYDKLSLNFTINQDNLRIEGTVANQNKPTVLADAAGTMLVEMPIPPRSLPISALLNTLAPGNSALVPATAQVQWLSSMLPMPKGLNQRAANLDAEKPPQAAGLTKTASEINR